MASILQTILSPRSQLFAATETATGPPCGREWKYFHPPRGLEDGTQVWMVFQLGGFIQGGTTKRLPTKQHIANGAPWFLMSEDASHVESQGMMSLILYLLFFLWCS